MIEHGRRLELLAFALALVLVALAIGGAVWLALY
jgi:hypothetical protein